MINSKKGLDYFNKVKEKLVVKEFSLKDIVPGNSTAIMGGPLPYPANINRDEFFKALDEMPFDECAAKYFPYISQAPISTKGKIKNFLRVLYYNKKNLHSFGESYIGTFLIVQLVLIFLKVKY